MFLIPSHIRKVLQSVLTEDAKEGAHTALLLLAHGQVLCTASNADSDWYSSTGGEDGEGSDEDDGDDEAGEDHDDEDQNEGEDDGDDEDEPYIPTPERNRMLRGIVKSQLLETDAFPDRTTAGGKKERGSIKIECDLGRLLLHPLSIPIPVPSSSSSSTPNQNNYSHPDPRLKHLTSIPNLSPQSLTYTLSAIGVEEMEDVSQSDGQEQQGGGTREGVVVLVLNGIRSVDWDVLERAAKAFEKDVRTKAG